MLRVPVAVLTGFLAVAACSNGGAQPVEQGKAAADHWLGLLASGDYDQAWEDASQHLKESISKKSWTASAREASQKRGPVVERALVDATYLPQHKYSVGLVDVVILTYRTTFTNPTPTKEQVAVVRDKDGSWRVYLHLPGLRG
jgi:hypothetical protein